MSAVFKGKFLEKLKNLIDSAAVLASPGTDIKALFNLLYRKDWIVYAKAPFGGPHSVIEYSGKVYSQSGH